MIDERKKCPNNPTGTYCKLNRPLSCYNPNRTPRHWKFTWHHQTTKRRKRREKHRKKIPRKICNQSRKPRHLRKQNGSKLSVTEKSAGMHADDKRPCTEEQKRAEGERWENPDCPRSKYENKGIANYKRDSCNT